MIDETNAKKIKINIYDITGNLLASKTDNLTKGMNGFDFDISNYQTGSYVYNIVADGIQVKSDKFILVK